MCRRYPRQSLPAEQSRKKVGQKLRLRGVLYEIKVIEPFDGNIIIISSTPRQAKKFVDFNAIESLVRDKIAEWL